MDVVQLANAAEFLERTGTLLADEARHNLILGLAGTIRDSPGLYREHELWVVEDGGSVVGAALRTPPYNLVLGHGNDEALELLAREVGGAIPGAVGAVPEIDDLVAACARLHGVTPQPRVEQGIYSLDTVVPPPAPAGGARPAASDDRELLVRWWGEFSAEALGALDQNEEDDRRNIDHRLTGTRSGIAFWEVEDEPVSFVAFGSPTPTGIRIGPVYTPPQHRGHGYASALTAQVSAEQLAAGWRFCFLYTDLGNPTSNKIYVAIGYRRVCESIQYAFV